ncbi:MAG TPA: hypothetical protein PKA90_07800 [Ignavibacteria bacterium]|nr:hypothetical protein [Ignavibacteria bacterium]HMR40321.1 hypothetical protein [Ignavibacteria bacterium]
MTDQTLIIGFFKEGDINKGTASWYGKYLNEIKELLPVNQLSRENTPRAIGYLLGKDNYDEKCFDINLLDFYNDEKTFRVNYIVDGNTEFNTAFIKKAIRDLIPKEKLKGPFLPLCVPVEKEKLNKLIDDETAMFKVKDLMKRNDWNGIYNMFTPLSEISKRDYLWNNDQLLNTLSFASAKLSETYTNLKFSFRSDEERKKYLGGQKKYREETIMLRKRCIELNPCKAAFYSNLGYSYYQFTRELTLPGGRRDGNIMEEAAKAVEYIDKALELDPQRVTDLYRKGQILAGIMPPQILFGGKNSLGVEAVQDANQKIKDGIECFKKVEQVWDILPVLEDRMIKRYHKEYVKSMYDTARAYSDLAGDSWNITQYLLPMKYDLIENENGSDNYFGKFEKEKLAYLDEAIAYMDKCSAADNTDLNARFPLPASIVIARFNGVCDGAHKLYSFGKYYFQKYLIMTSCDEYQKPEAEHYRNKAEEFFRAALRFEGKPENARQCRAYIAEKLARVLISKGEYENAIKTLKGFINDRTGYYIRYTYATACLLAGKYDEAGVQSSNAMKNERSNLEMWLGYFLLYIKNMKENKTAEAEKNLKMSMEICKKAGKKSPESLLIGQAYINYKKGDKESAVNCLREAEKINPGRKGIRRKIRIWEQNRNV